MWRHDFGCPRDRGLRDCISFVGRGFKPRAKQYNFLLVLDSITRPDCLFQASVILAYVKAEEMFWTLGMITKMSLVHIRYGGIKEYFTPTRMV